MPEKKKIKKSIQKEEEKRPKEKRTGENSKNKKQETYWVHNK